MQGLKPAWIECTLRGAEAPLFHRTSLDLGHPLQFCRKLQSFQGFGHKRFQ
jgi:hypothetical protein